MNQRNLSIDTLRLFAVFSVIMVHMGYGHLPKEYVDSIKLLGRWAVPFFFIISGYYLGKHSEIPRTSFRRTLRLTWILLFTSAIYLPVDYVQSGGVFACAKSIFSPVFFMRGTYFHLWFIGSMIVGYLVIAVFYEYNLSILLYPLTVSLILFALVTDSYNVRNIPIDASISRHLLSIPLMFIGIVMSRQNAPRLSLCFSICVLGIVLQFIESHFTYKYLAYDPWRHHFLVGTLLAAVGLSYVGINSAKILWSPFLASLGQKYTLGIYLLHPAMILVVTKIAYITQLSEFIAYSLLSPLIVLVCSTLALKFCAEYFPLIFSLLNGNPSTTKLDRGS